MYTQVTQRVWVVRNQTARVFDGTTYLFRAKLLSNERQQMQAYHVLRLRIADIQDQTLPPID